MKDCKAMAVHSDKPRLPLHSFILITIFCHSQNSALKNWKHFAAPNELIQHTLARKQENSKWRLSLGSSAF